VAVETGEVVESKFSTLSTASLPGMDGPKTKGFKKAMTGNTGSFIYRSVVVDRVLGEYQQSYSLLRDIDDGGKTENVILRALRKKNDASLGGVVSNEGVPSGLSRRNRGAEAGWSKRS